MLNKVLEVAMNNDNVRSTVLNELKHDLEMKLFVDLVIEMIEEKNKDNDSKFFVQDVYEEENTEFKAVIDQKHEKIEELKENCKVLISERDCYKKNIEDLKIESNLKIEKLQKNIEMLKIQNEDIMQKLENTKKENTNLNNKIVYFDNRYRELENIYSKYNGLSQDAREGLAGIFKDSNSIDLFLFSVAEYDKLEMLWDFIRNSIVNECHKEDIEDMNEIFNYFFNKYNEVSNGIYKRIEVRIGEDFDTEYHIRKGNKPSGEIKEVLLLGFINKNTNKVIKKTVVSL